MHIRTYGQDWPHARLRDFRIISLLISWNVPCNTQPFTRLPQSSLLAFYSVECWMLMAKLKISRYLAKLDKKWYKWHVRYNLGLYLHWKLLYLRFLGSFLQLFVCLCSPVQLFAALCSSLQLSVVFKLSFLTNIHKVRVLL